MSVLTKDRWVAQLTDRLPGQTPDGGHTRQAALDRGETVLRTRHAARYYRLKNALERLCSYVCTYARYQRNIPSPSTRSHGGHKLQPPFLQGPRAPHGVPEHGRPPNGRRHLYRLAQQAPHDPLLMTDTSRAGDTQKCSRGDDAGCYQGWLRVCASASTPCRSARLCVGRALCGRGRRHQIPITRLPSSLLRKPPAHMSGPHRSCLPRVACRLRLRLPSLRLHTGTQLTYSSHPAGYQ